MLTATTMFNYLWGSCMREKIKAMIMAFVCTFATSCFFNTEKAALNIAVCSNDLEYADNFIKEIKKEKVLGELGFNATDIKRIIETIDEAQSQVQKNNNIFFSDKESVTVPQCIVDDGRFDEAKEPVYLYLKDLKLKTEQLYRSASLSLNNMIVDKRSVNENAILYGLWAALSEKKYRLSIQMESKLLNDYYPEHIINKAHTPKKYGKHVAQFWNIAKMFFADHTEKSNVIEQDSVQIFYQSLEKHIDTLRATGIFFDNEHMHAIPSQERLNELGIGLLSSKVTK